MSKYKFRVWDSEVKCWMSPDLWLIDFEGNLICTDDSDGEGFIYGDELVIQQFTGLKDKNGKDIYEGDIVKGIGDTRISTGIFEIGFGPFGIKFKRYLKSGHVVNCSVLEFEVIGNIFENPELLKTWA